MISAIMGREKSERNNQLLMLIIGLSKFKMKIIFLDRKTIGEDLNLDKFNERSDEQPLNILNVFSNELVLKNV